MSEAAAPAVNDSFAAPPVFLDLLPYHAAIRDFLRRIDPDVWRWLAVQRASPKYAADVRFELLKTTYRIERSAQPALYEAADEAAARLGVAGPLTVYQSQEPEQLNASLAYVPGEVHLVLHGPIAERLSPRELLALFAHELAHDRLWSGFDGEIFTASQMLSALVSDPHAHPAHFASWRLFQLYSEIFCDRGALASVEDLAVVVSMLVKVQTGVTEVSPTDFLAQADEIFRIEDSTTRQVTHPEAYIRARAARLWSEGQADAETLIARMIEGRPGADDLDLLEQTRVAERTRRLIDVLLCRRWFQTDLVLAHARLYFEDYAPPADALTDAELARELRNAPPSLADYYCFVLLDFLTADRELEEPPLAAALCVAEELGLKPRLVELLRQELRLRKNVLDKVDKNKASILADLDRAAAG